jgi:hypothetical protein
VQQIKGPVSFDYDTTAGDQGQLNRGFVGPGSEVQVAVYLNGATDTLGVTDLANYSVVVQFEPDELTYIGFSDATDDEPNFLSVDGGSIVALPPILGANSVEFGNAILGPTAATSPDGRGLVGVLTFQATTLLDPSDLITTEYSVKSVDDAQQTFSTVIVGRVSSGEVDLSIPVVEITEQESGTVESESDFSGDGVVDFTDFFQFADVFGGSVEGAEVFGLNSDGAIDFSDFFIFADAFGQAAKPAGLLDAVGEIAVVTTVDETGDFILKTTIHTETEWDRWGLSLRFDPSQIDWVGSDDHVMALELEPGNMLVTGIGAIPSLRLAPVPLAQGEHLEQTITLEQAAAVRNPGTGVALALVPTGSSALPTIFHLYRNYPNPFNPSTTIRYQLPSAESVRLDIYDALGQHVRTLVQGLHQPGFYAAVWHGRDDKGRNAASGIYFFRMTAGRFVNTQKLLLVK